MAIIMKKYFFCLLSFSVAVLAPLKANERVVWTGDEPISWNTDVYAGTQFETPAGIFDGLQKDDTIKVSVEAKIEAPQYVMTYKAGSGWDWTDLTSVTVADGLMSYVVEDEIIAEEIATRGLVFRGQGYNMTQIVIASPEEPEPEPKPEGTYVDRDVWTGDVAISWNQDVYVGTELITLDVKQDMFAGLQEKDSIKIFYTEAIAGAQFALSYRDEDWNYVDLIVSEKDGFFAYKVASEEMAEAIADRGLIIRGQGYHATRIVIGTPESAEGIVTLSQSQGQSQKLIRNGRLIILRNGVEYTINGQKIQ